MVDFLRYDGEAYLVAPGTNELALSCPDCGQGDTVASFKYLSSTDKHTVCCGGCKQVLFPVLEPHGQLWAACLTEWTTGFGEQIRSLKKFGVPIGRLKEAPFVDLHRALTEWNPVLGYSCGWLDKGQLDFYLKDEDVRLRVARTLSDEDLTDALALVKKRKRAQLSSSVLVSADSTSNTLALMYAEAESLLALCVMLAQAEELARDGDPKHHSEITDLTHRCGLMRRIMTGQMKLPKGHTKLTYATEIPRAIATGAIASIKKTVDRFVRGSVDE